MLKNKNILLGISGSIAAYKCAELVREFKKSDANVKVLMTKSATEFLTPLTLQTLSQEKVIVDFVNEDGQTWNNHVELGLWADAFVIAPCTAKTLSGIANGYCDNILLATYLSAKCPVFVAPAMDLDMFAHQTTTNNLNQIKSFGNHIIDAKDGELASGLFGKGRMAEPLEIKDFVEAFFINSSPKKGKVLISAGPTYEAIDPVRFIGNRSSGKMGYAIANEFITKGYEVYLVSGPSKIKVPNGVKEFIQVESAQEMYEAVVRRSSSADILIMTAAVADYTPAEKKIKKIKKKTESIDISLCKTKDILAHLGEIKTAKQTLVGFALETNDGITYAQQKLIKKNADIIILNSISDKGAGFGHDTNKITVLNRNNKSKEYPLKSKKEVAEDIFSEIQDFLSFQ